MSFRVTAKTNAGDQVRAARAAAIRAAETAAADDKAAAAAALVEFVGELVGLNAAISMGKAFGARDTSAEHAAAELSTELQRIDAELTEKGFVIETTPDGQLRVEFGDGA